MATIYISNYKGEEKVEWYCGRFKDVDAFQSYVSHDGIIDKDEYKYHIQMFESGDVDVYTNLFILIYSIQNKDWGVYEKIVMNYYRKKSNLCDFKETIKYLNDGYKYNVDESNLVGRAESIVDKYLINQALNIDNITELNTVKKI